MSSTLRGLAVASCTALLVAGAAASAGASGSPAFTLRPTFGLLGSTVTLTGADFAGDTAVTINGTTADHFKLVNSHRITAQVPAGATSGRVDVMGAKPLTGPGFTVQKRATAVSAVSRRELTYTKPVFVSGHLSDTVTGHPVSGQLADLQHQIAGSKVWRHAGRTTDKKAGPHGGVRWRLMPSASGWYRVHFLATKSYTGATSIGHAVRVRPALHLQSIHTVPSLTTSQITGTIRPHLTGLVYLQRFANGAWHSAGKANVVDGRYSFDISPSALGTLQYRVVWRSDGRHVRTTTKSLHLQVVHRELVIGDTGSDVTALQKRLRALHYDIGSVNGDYGDDTLHAVTAFEKVQGITPDGEVSTKVWAALNRPKTIKLLHPTAGTYEVEVDIAKQVLLLGKNGHVVHILDTSTAGGYLYTNSEGGTSRAITPTGHFTIQYKLTGTRISKLGTLYYPSYFTDTGYAIHGEGNGNSGGEVPPYPNSHGCVRITDNAVLRYFSTPWLAVGSSVWIYG
jgi:N-acetylmuramoyl-L-alanine amidase